MQLSNQSNTATTLPAQTGIDTYDLVEDTVEDSSENIPKKSRTTESIKSNWGLQPRWLLASLMSVPLVATVFWWLGTRLFDSRLNFFEYHQFTVLTMGIIAGGYQLYFWTQRNNVQLSAKCMKIRLDDQVPFWPHWVWVYSFLYYVMIGLTVISIQDLADGVHLIFGGLILLTTGALIFYLYPTNVPESYRHFETDNLSTRYLAFIQSMDSNRNAFPSMHCAIATYIGLAIVGLPTIGPWLGYGYIVIIAISCVVVKQHVIIDTFAGVGLGAAIFFLNQWLALVV
jgi:membrane-associated phospholipid phosphatase